MKMNKRRDISEKINMAKALEDSRWRAEKFLALLKKSQKKTGDESRKEGGRINDLHSIKIGAEICTGSQSYSYDESIYSDVTLTNKIANLIIPACEERIKEIDRELNSLIR